MAISLNLQHEGQVIEVAVTGKLDVEDYDHFIPLVEAQIENHGKVRMIVKMIDFHGWSACALWKDIKFDFRHFSDISRLALLGDRTWEKGMEWFCKPFTSAQVRFFEFQEADAAHAWVEEGLSASQPA